MAKPIQILAASPIPPVGKVSSPHSWWCLCGLLALGKLGHGRVILPLLIGMSLAWSSSHLRCRQRATHISWVAAVTYFADWCLGACNSFLQSTGDLLFDIWHWRKPPRKVLYECTFGEPAQGQTLDVWGWHPDNANHMVKIPRFVTSSGRFSDSIFHSDRKK
jgi:hypothetical protein